MQDELIPFLHKKTIEGDAVALIEKYALDHNWGVKPPIPIEDIIEKHLKLPIDFNDLSKENAVGVIYSKERLKPWDNPSLESPQPWSPSLRALALGLQPWVLSFGALTLGLQLCG